MLFIISHYKQDSGYKVIKTTYIRKRRVATSLVINNLENMFISYVKHEGKDSYFHFGDRIIGAIRKCGPMAKIMLKIQMEGEGWVLYKENPACFFY